MHTSNTAHAARSLSSAKIIDGRLHARHLRDALRVKATELLAKFGMPPKLTVVLVGDEYHGFNR